MGRKLSLPTESEKTQELGELSFRQEVKLDFFDCLCMGQLSPRTSLSLTLTILAIPLMPLQETGDSKL